MEEEKEDDDDDDEDVEEEEEEEGTDFQKNERGSTRVCTVETMEFPFWNNFPVKTVCQKSIYRTEDSSELSSP